MTTTLDDPVAITAAAVALRRQADVYGDLGRLLRGLRTDGWTGTAADAFRAELGGQSARWFDASDVLLVAAGALDGHADVARWTDDRLAEARELRARSALVASPDAAVRMVERAAEIAGDALDAFDESSWRTALRLEDAADAAPATPGRAHDPWWTRALRAAANAGVDAVNAVVSAGTAVRHHPGDVAGLMAGAALFDVGTGGALASLAADATGVGAVVGLPAGAAAVGLAGAGVLLGGGSAADLWRHATSDDARTPLDELPEGERLVAVTRQGKTRIGAADPAPPPRVTPGWIKFPAQNGQGWVWQEPGSFPTGSDANQFRIMRPTWRYPDGYVRFTNAREQPLDVFGKPTSHAETHLGMTADGTYPIPEGWSH